MKFKYYIINGLLLLTFLYSFPASIKAWDSTSTRSYFKKGDAYLYWGWNRGKYSKSSITFSGSDYDFELKKVVADDRPSPFDAKVYLNPMNATIPQYNFRIGYSFKDNWDFSAGIDHMKYVARENQATEITGFIGHSDSPFNGTYDHDQIELVQSFLLYEHTDGLNYGNFELQHSNQLADFGKLKLAMKEGVGLGIVIPRTNATLLGNERYDEFHLAGFGLHGVVGMNVLFFNHFFIQGELKSGFIDLPDVRTTHSKSDRAKQHFFFAQYNMLFGVRFQIAGERQSLKDTPNR